MYLLTRLHLNVHLDNPLWNSQAKDAGLWLFIPDG